MHYYNSTAHALDIPEHDQQQHHDERQTESTTGIIAPIVAVRPNRNGSKQQDNEKNDE
jgi:hypothetical protein